MLGEGETDRQAGDRRRFLRSVSWTDRSPTKPLLPRAAQPSFKARSCLPPLRPLSVPRPNVDEWPKAGSDDLGVWPQPATPGGRIGGSGVETSGKSKLEAPSRQFESNKEKLAFFEKECSRIADHIYLGSDAVAKNREMLRQNGITHVLNCVGFLCPEYFKGDLVYKTLWLQDSPSEDITSILYDVFDYFEDVREQGGRVFVHCSQGVSRSTSLVIAYLMWREGQSYEDAFEYVKAARGVTNPNMGFACQLLQCQKRVHAIPASPTSVLRMYRMAPHSPYDPLHLVPKMLAYPSPQGLDSRGAFVIHVPSAIYVWIGKYCSSTMSNNAKVVAHQVVKYEKAKGPMSVVTEGEEPSEFWNAFSMGEQLKDSDQTMEPKEDETMHDECDVTSMATEVHVGNRKVDEYDRDFEIFHKALSGGVVPPFTTSGSGSETCLPVRGNGWGKLRTKFANGASREFLLSPGLDRHTSQSSHEKNETCPCLHVVEEEPVSPIAHLLKLTPKTDLPDCILPDRGSKFCEEFERSSDSTGSSLLLLTRFSSPVTSFSKSPSLSPSTSDNSSSLTFSPSSSNWSDLSNLSLQSSPSGLESSDNHLPPKNSPVVGSDCVLQKTTARSCMEAFPATSSPPILLLPPTAKPTRLQRIWARSQSFSHPGLNEKTTSVVDGIGNQLGRKDVIRDEPMPDADQQ